MIVLISRKLRRPRTTTRKIRAAKRRLLYVANYRRGRRLVQFLCESGVNLRPKAELRFLFII